MKLPILQDPKVLGDSLDMAQKRFLNLERRLLKDKTPLSNIISSLLNIFSWITWD